MVGAWSRRTLGGLATAALVACAPSAVAAPRIVGGEPAGRSHPYAAFVKLRFADGTDGFCGGALVAARYVVTAGHCVEGRPTSIGVTVGSAHVSHEGDQQFEGVPALRDPRFAIVGDEPADDAAV